MSDIKLPSDILRDEHNSREAYVDLKIFTEIVQHLTIVPVVIIVTEYVSPAPDPSDIFNDNPFAGGLGRRYFYLLGLACTFPTKLIEFGIEVSDSLPITKTNILRWMKSNPDKKLKELINTIKEPFLIYHVEKEHFYLRTPKDFAIGRIRFYIEVTHRYISLGPRYVVPFEIFVDSLLGDISLDELTIKEHPREVKKKFRVIHAYCYKYCITWKLTKYIK